LIQADSGKYTQPVQQSEDQSTLATKILRSQIQGHHSVSSTATFVKKFTVTFPVQSLLSHGLIDDRFDSGANGWIFPVSVTEDHLPTISIGIGDPSVPGGEMIVSILPRDLSYATAYPGYLFGRH
jgi:hypothetical protein